MHSPSSFRLLATVLLALAMGASPFAASDDSDGIPSFYDSAGWLNSRPLSPRDLEGKVVLVDFWEYTCVNCLRTLPYLRTWYERYHDKGLVIVGVHTPEYAFTHEEKNVSEAVRHLDIRWPVVLDSQWMIWKRYNAQSWPTEYLFDGSGQLVDKVSGEGGYEQTEAKIQALLRAQNPKLTFPPVMALLPQDNYTKPGAVCYVQTPEVLMEHAQIGDAAKGADRRRDQTYTDAAAPHEDGVPYLQGAWRMTDESAVSTSVPAYFAMRYHAIQVVGVLAPPKGVPLRVDVTQDGAPLAKTDAGDDVRYDSAGMSYVTVDSARAYDLVMNAKMAAHELRLTPQAAGMSVYSFAFESCEATTKS
jgi:thiol-disulfide isomerase/thioredoxin